MRGHVAVGVIEVAVLAGPGHRVRAGARAAVAEGADVGLAREVAERVVGVAGGRQGPAAGGGVDQAGGGQAVDAVVAMGSGSVLLGNPRRLANSGRLSREIGRLSPDLSLVEKWR